ncbi:hypothetical protein, partial [Methanopyrus sp.]
MVTLVEGRFRSPPRGDPEFPLRADPLSPVYVPRVQFLKDVDGDGRVDHLHSSEAAALEYLIALGHDLDPFDV